MSQAVTAPRSEPWFLVHRDGALPDVVMEFETKEEAEDALCATWVDRIAERGPDADALRITIFSVSEMFEDPSLRRALETWDEHVVQLEVQSTNVMEQLFLGGDAAPILRPGRGPNR